MTVTVSSRRAHQLQVAALLDELEERRRHLHRLKAGGARRAGLRDLKSELEEARLRLIHTIAQKVYLRDNNRNKAVTERS